MYKIISTNDEVEWKKILTRCSEQSIFFTSNYLKNFDDKKFTKAKIFFIIVEMNFLFYLF